MALSSAQFNSWDTNHRLHLRAAVAVRPLAETHAFEVIGECGHRLEVVNKWQVEGWEKRIAEQRRHRKRCDYCPKPAPETDAKAAAADAPATTPATDGPDGPVEPTVVDIAGVPTPMRVMIGEREVTMDEWNLAHSTSGATLRAACRGEGLAISGTNAARARRLVAAGLTRDQVEEKYGWRARRAATQTDHEG